MPAQITKEFIETHLLNKNGLIIGKNRIKYCPNVSIEDLYFIYTGIKAPKCKLIGCQNLVKFNSFTAGYTNIYCSDICSCYCTERIEKEKRTSIKNNSKQITCEKRKETWLLKYGCENVSQSDIIQEKRNATIIKNDSFGDEFVTNRKVTYKTLYGSDHYMKSEVAKALCEERNIKREVTSQEKYGVSCVFKDKNIIEKIKRIKILKGIFLSSELKEPFRIYELLVWSITNKQPLKELKNYEKRGNVGYKKDAYHLDHKISIKYGFENNILPYIIGNIDNLQMLPARENCSKGSKSWSLLQ